MLRWLTMGRLVLYPRKAVKMPEIESRSCAEWAVGSPTTSCTYVCSDNRFMLSPQVVSIVESQSLVLVSPHATRTPVGASFLINVAAALCRTTYRSTGTYPS